MTDNRVGRLTKTTNSRQERGVTGQRCVAWETSTPNPPSSSSGSGSSSSSSTVCYEYLSRAELHALLQQAMAMGYSSVSVENPRQVPCD